jgi:cobalt/nickel transport system ATP-binding protein
MHHTIEVQDLQFNYPDGHSALKGVSLHVEMCEKVALVGPNGAGKSTLMLHLNGILNGQGRVKIAGLEMTPANLKRIRARVGMVFQSPDDQLFSPTVFEDVAFGPIYQGLPEAEVRRRVDEALAAVRMSDYANRVSHHLSTGEKKRIAIASVLSMQPEVLVLDEPSRRPRPARPPHVDPCWTNCPSPCWSRATTCTWCASCSRAWLSWTTRPCWLPTAWKNHNRLVFDYRC